MTGDVLRLEPVRSALSELGERDAVTRLLARDPGLWVDDPAAQDAVTNRLGWLDVAGGMEASDRLAAFVEAVAAEPLPRIVLAGMGGSSLAPEVFARTFQGRVAGAQLTVLDSTHPERVRTVLEDSDLASTLVVVSSKSGGTVETRCLADRAHGLMPGPEHLVAITDAGSELEQEAYRRGYREVFTNPPDIGGRYSALSLFGMVPAALVGVDVAAIWRSSELMLGHCRQRVEDNPGAMLGAFMAGLARVGRDKLTVLAPPRLAALGDWIEQLVAESTGKHGTGIVPVVGEPHADVDVYGDDRAFVALRLGDQEPPGLGALAAAGHPVHVCDVADVDALGGEFVRWEVATALAGSLLGVNPFDEPDVAEAKANTAAILSEVAEGAALPDPEDGRLGDALATLAAGDYLALQAYLDPTPERAASLSRLRALVSQRTRVATTLGWGPRFLHSTGQLHKGGPDALVVVQLVDSRLWADTGHPVDIPGHDYDFATLIRAQATGDLRSLRRRGRRVTQIPVASVGDLDRLADEAAAALG